MVLFFLAFFILLPLPKTLHKDDYSLVVKSCNGKIIRVFLNKKGEFQFPPDFKKEVPYKLKKCIMAYEDRYFYYHPGVNPVSLIRALKQNIKAHKIVSGGSTLTMQVARLLKPKPRTIPNKILEILQAIKLEFIYSKEKILRLYISYAPYGGNIVGAEAAASKYFGKDINELTWSEAATLAVLPNSPGIISPMANPTILKEKRDKLLEKLVQMKIIDRKTCNLAKKEKNTNYVADFNLIAPHFTRMISLKGYRGVCVTTLDTSIYEKVNTIIQTHAEFLKKLGINNISALVVDTQSGKIRAWVGSNNFFDKKNDGMVDGVIAPRSSGSILKPFLYALGIDYGMFLPPTKIKDVPSIYKGFTPQNAEMKFSGLVSVKDALIKSLNVPAVRVLRNFGVYNFYNFLKEAGVTTLFRPCDDYGLTLILGGAEVKLLEMVNLYRGLANYGRFTPLKFIENPVGEKNYSKQLIGRMSAYLILNCLKDLKRPGAEFYWQLYNNQWPIAWKTGTSYGLRDAWAIGVTPQWTIGVWAGNFNGDSNPNIGGARVAGPILFDIFNILPKDKKKAWFTPPVSDMDIIPICTETGYPASEICPHKKYTECPKNFEPKRVCPYHKKIAVDVETGYTVCSRCWRDGKYEYKTFLVYTPDIIQCFRKNGLIIEKIPQHNPECRYHEDEKVLQITYPKANSKIWIPKDFDETYQKVIFSAAHRDIKSKVFWYLDRNYLGYTVGTHQKAVFLEKGKHKLVLVDENGFKSMCEFESLLH